MRPGAGARRHLITIEKPNPPTPDEVGGRVITYSTVGEYWASIETTGGMEANAKIKEGFLQRYGEVSHAITMLFVPDITSAMRIVFGEKIFNIVTVENADERNIELLINAVEVS